MITIIDGRRLHYDGLNKHIDYINIHDIDGYSVDTIMISDVVLLKINDNRYKILKSRRGMLIVGDQIDHNEAMELINRNMLMCRDIDSVRQARVNRENAFRDGINTEVETDNEDDTGAEIDNEEEEE
jgi:hypothetical protein